MLCINLRIGSSTCPKVIIDRDATQSTEVNKILVKLTTHNNELAKLIDLLIIKKFDILDPASFTLIVI